MAAAPSSAGAAAQVSTPTLDFGSVSVGASSAPQTVTLTETCTVFDSTVTNTCLTSTADVFNVAPSASGDFTTAANAGSPCPASLSPTTTNSVSCAVDVVFTPTAAGARAGTLSTGTVFPAGAGPTVGLTGTGTASGGGGDPSGGVPSSGAGVPPAGSGAGATPSAAAKKCKKAKKRAAQVAKKCKKKRRK